MGDKRMNKTYILAMLVLFMSGAFVVPGFASYDAAVQSEMVQVDSVLAGQVPRDIRVALYDEPNTTIPDYGWGGMTSTNITSVVLMLESAGYDVTTLTFQDILDHELKVADYDVFVMFDNNPRENITLLVKQYWLGGGGILSIDGAINYINYFGIMVPDTEGTNDYGDDWYYSWAENQTVENRHPVTKDFEVGQTITNAFDWAVYNTSLLLTCSTASEYTILTTAGTGHFWVNGLARDPEYQGGRVVQIFGDDNSERAPNADLLTEAVDWLTMRPKGRILFDLTNTPYYGVDIRDPSSYNSEARYFELRDYWVRNKFTCDKAYPDDGPLTLAFLRHYDMVFINAPDDAYTAAEINAIHEWVSEGGGLLLAGEWPSFADQNANIRQILAGYDMNITTTQYNTDTITANVTAHPVNEGVGSVDFSGGSFVESWGDAFTLIWLNAPNEEMLVAQEVGLGRVILSADINFIGNYIDYEDNVDLAENIANWLCSDGADILLYTDGPGSLGPDYTFYRSPAALALNELGLNYFMTNDLAMLNQSLAMQSWGLIIIDANYYTPTAYHGLIRDYLEGGGKVIWRDWNFRSSGYNEMWNYLGWNGTDSYVSMGPVPIYLWDDGHSLFNVPVEYGATTIESSHDLFTTDFVNVDLLGNATALAGATSTYNNTQAGIVVSVGGQALCNLFAISEYLDDTDDSTYADNYELFINEIAFMMRPTIDQPDDIEFSVGETGYEIVWNPESPLPVSYVIYQDSSEVVNAVWSGGQVTYNLDGLPSGTYVFEITVYDNNGCTAMDEVTVHVLAPFGGLPMTLIIAGAAAVVIVVVVLLIYNQRKPKS
jgi:hypothetical protein